MAHRIAVAKDALMVASRDGNTAKVKSVIKVEELAMGDMDHDAVGNTCGHWACLNSHLETLIALQEGGHSKLNDKNKLNGWTLLHAAAFSGSVDIVNYLVANYTANPPRRGMDRRGSTASYASVGSVVSAVMSSSHMGGMRETGGTSRASVGRQSSIAPSHSRRPSSSSAGTVTWNRKAANAWITANSAVQFLNAKNHEGRSALHLAVMEGHDLVIEALIGAGAEVNTFCRVLRTPLHMACHSGRSDVAAYLIDHGADANAKCSKKMSPLHLACEKGHWDVVCLLVEAGADLDVQDIMGDTPLHLTVEFSRERCFTILLQNDADKNVKNRKGKTAIETIESSSMRQCYAALEMKDQQIKSRAAAEKNKVKQELFDTRSSASRSQRCLNIA